MSLTPKKVKWHRGGLQVALQGLQVALGWYFDGKNTAIASFFGVFE